jgi:thiol-disulfide isomerase/thioredoxin
MKKYIVLVLLVFITIFVGSSIGLSPKEEAVRQLPPKIGDIAPDIVLLSTDRATTYKLSDLRGKMVLVNFWASLVAPCRFENPNILRAYQHYATKNFKSGNGFIVFSVSMDTDLESWRTAIARDNLVWPYHVSDLRGYDSEVANTYGIKAIPYNYLIDGSGKVIAINLRGAELNKLLQEELK